jgi:hypothetical protein
MPQERALCAELKQGCLGLSSLERTIACQRARVRYLAKGDANTKYFHMLAQGRQRRNFITSLKVDRVTVTTQHAMANALHDHFVQVFGCPGQLDGMIDLAELGIVNHELMSLDQPISKEEIWAAIREMPSDRASGPDGFTGAFYKASWPVIKYDTIAGDSRAFGRLNGTLIVLLPADFRPITMIHSFAKLLSKILALCLAPRMQELISPNQNAFIRGRSIHDNFKYVQRAAVLIRKKKIPKLLLKLDVSKAFGTVVWPFLLDVMQAMGFGPCWRRWIAGLLSTASSRITLNGQLGPPIMHRCGVWQGDSLSPLLFILAMEVLSRMFTRARELGLLRGMTRDGVKYQCSIYADDVILFAHRNVHEATAIKEILQFFGDTSSLRTNMAKCSITDIYASEDALTYVQQILGCQITTFPICYLGLPLSTSKVQKCITDSSSGRRVYQSRPLVV